MRRMKIFDYKKRTLELKTSMKRKIDAKNTEEGNPECRTKPGEIWTQFFFEF